MAVKGKKEAVLVYELLGLRVEANKQFEELANTAMAAILCYRDRDWKGANDLFGAILESHPNDGPAQSAGVPLSGVSGGAAAGGMGWRASDGGEVSE